VIPLIDKENFEPEERLANAIIALAVKDYKHALLVLKRNGRSYGANKRKEEVERFFLSDWFVTLSNLDGKALMEKVRKEVDW
jgi:hypothetical protein